VLNLEYPKDLLEVLVVSDGSTDATDAIAQSFSGAGVQLLRVPWGGKPAALNAAIERASGEILLLTDVRQILAGNSLRFLVDCFADPSVGAASGQLLLRKSLAQEEEDMGLYRRYEAWIRERLSRIDSIFGAVGSFYALRRELAIRIPEDILLDDVYLPLAAYFSGRRLIVEQRAVAWDIPVPLKTEFRRKVRTIAGNYQLLAARPALLGWRNRMWFHFMSYKVARLLMPYALVLAAVSSFFLPRPWNWLALASQAGFYGLAAIDPLVPEKAALKRVSSLIRTFVTLLVATLCALQVLFVSPRKLWEATNPGSVEDRPPIRTPSAEGPL
jgi:cellulose synthase/poly-beta-1,6-N-acetylglucosamine synthase-like glycosyltransferase